MFLSALVCLFVSSIMLAISFYIIWWKGGIWATEEPIRFCWSSRSRYIRVIVRVAVVVRWEHHRTPHWRIRVNWHLFNSNNFVSSAALTGMLCTECHCSVKSSWLLTRHQVKISLRIKCCCWLSLVFKAAEWCVFHWLLGYLVRCQEEHLSHIKTLL